MKKTLNHIFCIVFLSLIFSENINAQQGARIELSAGPTIGDASEDFSFTLQGNFYYLSNVSKNINIGATAGVLVFLGDGNSTTDYSYFDFGSIPDVYIPIAFAGRIELSKLISVGSDIGYAINANGFSDGEGGFYLKPIIAFNVSEKFALTGSYINISESGYNASSINFGINFGF